MSQLLRDLTLRGYYERAYRTTFLAGCRPTTEAVYRTTLALWEQLLPELRLTEIDNRWLGAFRDKLSQRETSPQTVNKYLRTVNALLAKAGPASSSCRDALGLLPTSPWAKLLKTHTTRPRAIPLDVLGFIYRACERAMLPRGSGIDPAAWWRGLVVCASQTALRRSALLGIEWRMIDGAENALHLPASLDKMGVERVKPLTRVVINHLRELRPDEADPEAKIFPWPYRSMRMFLIQWHALQQAAGVPLEAMFKFHDLKKTCGTQLATVAGAHAVREMLDHTSIEMSQHYVAGTEALRAALERMPRPREFEQAEIHHRDTEVAERNGE